MAEPNALYDPQTERLEEVNDGLSLIQIKGGFIFGTDSVALCDAVSGHYACALDLGTGSGIIPLLLLTRGRVDSFTGVEIQTEYASLARRNAALNGLSDRFAVLEGDIVRPSEWISADGTALRGRKFDLVVSNPPYIRAGSGHSSPTSHRDIARMEVLCDIRDVCRCASGFLETGGDFAIVHRADRLASLICALREYALEPKELTLLHKGDGKPASLVVVKAKKDSGEELKVFTRMV